MGYAGGNKENPTYYSLGDHSETIEIDYDPTRITYKQLLDVFWTNHDPASPAWSRQYASVIFYHDENQKRIAEESKAKTAGRLRTRLATEIVPYDGFNLAEDYHQKYDLRRFPQFLEEFQKIYPATHEFLQSTAVTRVNGYLGGQGTYEELVIEIGMLGLSPARQEELKDIVLRHHNSAFCPIP